MFLYNTFCLQVTCVINNFQQFLPSPPPLGPQHPEPMLGVPMVALPCVESPLEKLSGTQVRGRGGCEKQSCSQMSDKHPLSFYWHVLSHPLLKTKHACPKPNMHPWYQLRHQSNSFTFFFCTPFSCCRLIRTWICQDRPNSSLNPYGSISLGCNYCTGVWFSIHNCKEIYWNFSVCNQQTVHPLFALTVFKHCSQLFCAHLKELYSKLEMLFHFPAPPISCLSWSTWANFGSSSYNLI